MMHRVPVLLAALVLAPVQSVEAQSSRDGARAVVQPLPSPAVGQLNAALRRISRNPRDVEALTDAGFASLRLDDVEAAVGFFTRAQEVQPNNAQVKIGLASAYLRSERPVEALQLYREAEQAGASTLAMAADRGLAYDLVGDNAAAQQEYARALNGPNGDEVRRRLALSQAIQGNREGFERTLYPLLEKQDFAAYRTRAFALAILGEEKEAVAITEAVMPADLAARIAPYLNFMRRLTPAQQAAAANLGNFPRAAQIGRDDPRIAAYRAASTGVRSADAALAPVGAPLGAQNQPTQARADPAAQRRRPGRGASRVEEAPSAQPVANPQTIARAAPSPAAPAPEAAVVARSDQAQEPPPTQPTAGQPPAALPPATPPVPTVLAQAEPPPQLPPSALPGAAASMPPAIVPDEPAPTAPVPVATSIVAADVPQSAASAPGLQPGFDLARVAPPPAPAESAQPSAQQTPTPATAPARVADAFAEFATTAAPVVVRDPDAVDITRIRPPREVEKKPEPVVAKPAPPPVPSRHWVQLATGRDKSALRFDWRRFAAKAPDVLGKLDPHVTAWGQAHRLLAGPYDTPKAANTALAALKKAGLDGFVFTSEAGQNVEKLR